MGFDVALAAERVRATLLPALDIVAERVHDQTVPAWCNARGWSDCLLGLGQAELERCEAEGLAFVADALPGVPQSLAELAARVRELSQLPTLDSGSSRQANEDYRGVSARKREQLSTLLGALPKLAAPAKRIVDVGAGSGHFTRLAASHFSRAALGLERNPERVESASIRARLQGGEAALLAEFAVIDAGREPLLLRPDDLAIGLHACGELGDALVRAVAESGADLALVSCCLQKISAHTRTPLSARGLRFERETLGLSNLTSQALGVEAGIQVTMRAREARYALGCLLRARGLDIPPGAEMRGINRRRAHAGLRDIAERALLQRGLTAASNAELGVHEREAARHFAIVRRLSLPRNMLARAVELSVVLDRAMRLHECGYTVCVATLFDRAVTPRNIALFASRDGTRLPRLRALGATPAPDSTLR
jgi:SAM-dependent methyltransferase